MKIQQESGCAAKKQKKSRKKRKLGNDAAHGSSQMSDGDQDTKNIQQTKAGNSTTAAVGAGNVASSIPKAGKKKKNKNKNAANGVVDGHKGNPANFSGVNTVEGNTSKNSSRLANDDLIKSSAQSPTEDGNKRKRNNSDEGNGRMNSKDNVEDVHSSKKLKTDAVCENHVPSAAFESYRISQTMADNLRSKGIESLFLVQSLSFDTIYDGCDIIVQARTGSGKTLSFAVPLLEKLHKFGKQQHGRPPQILVMAPTRELAKQVSDTFGTFAAPTVNVLSVYGGTPIYPQEQRLRAGVDIVVGTPGRIKDLLQRGCLDLSKLKHVVLDEVDRMLDMGFADDVEAILAYRYSADRTGCNPQTLLFSATMPHWVHETAKKYLRSDRRHLDLVCDDVVKTSKTVQMNAVNQAAGGGDLGAAEAQCSTMGVSSWAVEEEEYANDGQRSTVTCVSAQTAKGKDKPSDVLLSSLQQQLQESAKQFQQLQQSVKPPTEQEVFGQYVKGALMTMSRRRYRRARREIGAILESLQDSDGEEQVVHSQVASLPPHASLKGPPTSRSTSAPSFLSSTPNLGNTWQPQPHVWKNVWPPTGTPRQSQEFACMDKYPAGSIIPPPPPQFAHNQQQYGQQQFQQQQQQNMLTGAVDASDVPLPSGLGPSLSELYEVSGFLYNSPASATGSARGMNTPATTAAAAAQQY